MERREKVGKYFAPFPKWTLWAIGIGVLMLTATLFGLVLIGIGGWFLFSWTQKPSDAEIDALIEEDLKTLNGKALSKTGTDESELVGESVVVTGVRFWNVGGAKIGYNKGKDNVFRFTPIGVTVLNFTANQLLSYSCALDLYTGQPLNESTDEYFYKDVVSVSTKTRNFNMDLPVLGLVKLTAAEIFELTTSGGNSLEVVLRDPGLIAKMGGGGEIPTTRAEKAIQTVRKMLREKKAA